MVRTSITSLREVMSGLEVRGSKKRGVGITNLRKGTVDAEVHDG